MALDLLEQEFTKTLKLKVNNSSEITLMVKILGNLSFWEFPGPGASKRNPRFNRAPSIF
jgi:hypothetical protein